MVWQGEVKVEIESFDVIEFAIVSREQVNPLTPSRHPPPMPETVEGPDEVRLVSVLVSVGQFSPMRHPPPMPDAVEGPDEVVSRGEMLGAEITRQQDCSPEEPK